MTSTERNVAEPVTQNLDGLRQRAGSTSVIEAHGTITKAREIGSNDLFDFNPVLGSSQPPLSPAGSRRTRPDIVLFGEQPRGMAEAITAVQSAQLLMFAGTSGNVWPISGLYDIAREAGVPTLLINDEPWRTGRECDITVIDDVTALDSLVPHD